MIYFEYKLKANLFWCAWKKHFMRIEFQNSIRRLGSLCRLPDIKIVWINPWLIIVGKGFWKLSYANKTKEPMTSQKVGSWDFRHIVNSILNKGKSAMPLFSGLEVFPSASDKTKLFTKNFLKNLNVDNSIISLYTCLPF